MKNLLYNHISIYHHAHFPPQHLTTLLLLVTAATAVTALPWPCSAGPAGPRYKRGIMRGKKWFYIYVWIFVILEIIRRVCYCYYLYFVWFVCFFINIKEIYYKINASPFPFHPCPIPHPPSPRPHACLIKPACRPRASPLGSIIYIYIQ